MIIRRKSLDALQQEINTFLTHQKMMLDMLKFEYHETLVGEEMYFTMVMFFVPMGAIG